MTVIDKSSHVDINLIVVLEYILFQVNKTGAYLLLLWLLHDLTLSAHGVMVKNEPLAKKYLRQLKDSSEEALKIKFGD